MRDTYGYEVTSDRRHPKCSCEVPCQKRYACEAPHHEGSRFTPWCNGCIDNRPEWCDECWAKEYVKNGRA